ncbi:LPP20 family lipoprotein [Vibrio palustris]|uniref:LPP20 lipoprotein n=1 Tax=Vibrio palustris TaxID=1918946 RepID=A0A1R4B3K9_9VIBR|nr:LPP20 family lipoprotein [Vibrio palustris]SJL83499.1 hypothetical protein VPAL9027_01467 [Vibrio palustris]
MNILKNWLVIGLVTLLSACQSSAPHWYTQPQVTQTQHSQYLSAVGHGRSLYEAKQTALSQINSDLLVSIESQSSSASSSRQYTQSINGETRRLDAASQIAQRHINSRTANITFTGIDYPQVEHNDLGYYVQAQIKRSHIINQLRTDISDINHQATQALAQYSHQDHLLWWLEHRHDTDFLAQVQTRQAMLRSLTPSVPLPQAPTVDTLLSKINQVKNTLLIAINHSPGNEKGAQFLANAINQQGIATHQGSTRQATHKLTMTTEFRRDYLQSSFITTMVTTLHLTNAHNNHTLSTSEIISTGNSVSNRAMGDESAERNFSEIIKNTGIWSSLNLN